MLFTSDKPNLVMIRHFKDENWTNAYKQVNLPNTLSEYAAVASAAFNENIVAIRPTSEEFNKFNGMQYK